MPKLVRAFSLMVALAPVLRPLSAQQVSTNLPPHIEATGVGERRVAPDRATVMVNITAKAASAAGAAAENARVQTRVMDTLRAIGLGGAATTASYNVGPNY